MFTKLRATLLIVVLALPSIVWAQAGSLQDFGGLVEPSAPAVVYTAGLDKTFDDKLVMAIGSES